MNDICVWTESDGKGVYIVWDTQCDSAQKFELGGTPSDNGFAYCPYCGNRIVAIPYHETNDANG